MSLSVELWVCAAEMPRFGCVDACLSWNMGSFRPLALHILSFISFSFLRISCCKFYAGWRPVQIQFTCIFSPPSQSGYCGIFFFLLLAQIYHYISLVNFSAQRLFNSRISTWLLFLKICLSSDIDHQITPLLGISLPSVAGLLECACVFMTVVIFDQWNSVLTSFALVPAILCNSIHFPVF